jgi:SAM-dependent methyltransferase
MSEPVYYKILRHYEECFEKYGASHRGMDWPNEEDLVKRFDVMLEVVRPNAEKPVSILDLGCGVGLLVDHLQATDALNAFDYWGIDLSTKMVAAARERHPAQRFESRDILSNPLPAGCVDYVIMNGLLTEKVQLSQPTMEAYATDIIKMAFDACRRGIAFNVMSTHLDWLRNDLFHWPLDSVAAFLVSQCSRSIVIRMDYGLYEYTVYVYNEASQ